MDHKSAIQNNAVERYLLGEMPLEERDSFEEHYFACSECAEDIRLGAAMRRDMKVVLREGPARNWFGWLRIPVLVPSCAAAALALVVGYQNLVQMPELRAPRGGAALILDGQTRAAVPQLKAGDALCFEMSVDGLTTADRLEAELLQASGSKEASGEIAAPPAHQPLNVVFPGTVAPGRYILVIREANGHKEIARSSFQVIPK